MVLHGERPALELIEGVEAAIAARQQAAKDATHAGRGRAQGLSAAAHLMRERRKDPEVRLQERLIQKARSRALENLAKNHPEEFLVLVQQERKAAGLAVLIPRNRRKTNPPTKVPSRTVEPQKAPTPVPKESVPAIVTRPLPKEVQDKCRHNMGLRKLAYGTFCTECGAKVR